jgi:hypothetical protein
MMTLDIENDPALAFAAGCLLKQRQGIADDVAAYYLPDELRAFVDGLNRNERRQLLALAKRVVIRRRTPLREIQ